MNFSFFMMVGFLGTITGFVLNIFEPTRVNNVLVYNNNSYLLLFGIFLALMNKNVDLTIILSKLLDIYQTKLYT